MVASAMGCFVDASTTFPLRRDSAPANALDAITTSGTVPATVDSNPMGPDTTKAAAEATQYAAQQRHIVESVRPDERSKSLKQLLVSKTEQCLVGRGYSKFELTEDQRHALRKLKAGSDERRAYLYSLASNPAVLQNQRIAGQP